MAVFAELICRNVPPPTGRKSRIVLFRFSMKFIVFAPAVIGIRIISQNPVGVKAVQIYVRIAIDEHI